MRMVAVLVLCLGAAACGLPRDAAGTLKRVRGGVIRVGVIENPPWVMDVSGDPQGVEPALVKTLAAELGAQVQWTRGPEHDLMRALHERRLDLVAGGLDDTVPWAKGVALTRPYYRDERRHVLAAPRGENAWLVRIEEHLHRAEPQVGARLAEFSR
jgi:polar amino acid transport system substrate-binding protein